MPVCEVGSIKKRKRKRLKRSQLKSFGDYRELLKVSE
jgi:hypothetical protein